MKDRFERRLKEYGLYSDVPGALTNWENCWEGRKKIKKALKGIEKIMVCTDKSIETKVGFSEGEIYMVSCEALYRKKIKNGIGDIYIQKDGKTFLYAYAHLSGPEIDSYRTWLGATTYSKTSPFYVSGSICTISNFPKETMKQIENFLKKQNFRFGGGGPPDKSKRLDKIFF